MKKVLESDRRLTIAFISDETGLSVGTIHSIVTEDLVMSKVCEAGAKSLERGTKTVTGGNFERNFGLRPGR